MHCGVLIGTVGRLMTIPKSTRTRGQRFQILHLSEQMCGDLPTRRWQRRRHEDEQNLMNTYTQLELTTFVSLVSQKRITFLMVLECF